MNKTLQKLIRTAMILAIALPFAACGNKNESWSTETTDPDSQVIVNPDATVITFAVPSFCHVEDSNLRLFNEELIKDGYKYQLQIKCFEYDFENNKYFENVEKELKSGNAEVAFLGLGDEDKNIYKLINSGAVLNLDEVLSSDEGKVLYKAFPAPLWEAVKCNGHIFSIPQTNLDDQGIYAAFNKDYIGEEDIENWDGSIDGIYKMIKNVEWNDNAAPRFQYMIADYDFDKMLGCEIRDGLLYDYDTMKIENALESEKLIKYLKVLEQMKSDGYMSDSVTYYQNTPTDVDVANLVSGKFLAVLATGEPAEYLYKNNICIKKLPPFLSPRINTSIGISSNTEKLSAVVDFLGIFYTEEKYGNLLLYGRQDIDYKIKDGFAVRMDDTEMPYDFMTKVSLNLFINLHPVKGETFAVNRKEEYVSFYKNVKLSPFIGFEADTTGNSAISENINGFLESLNGSSLDEAVNEYSQIQKAAGIDEYVTSVNKQWEEFHK